MAGTRRPIGWTLAGVFFATGIGLARAECESYEFRREFNAVQDNGYNVVFHLSELQGGEATGSAEYFAGANFDQVLGRARARFDGKRLGIEVHWQNGAVGYYDGNIVNGVPQGITRDLRRSDGAVVWRSRQTFDCLASASVPERPPASAPAPAESPSGSPRSQIGSIGSAVLPADCKPGFVWRGARANDLVCVTPESRDRVALENHLAPTRLDPSGASGLNGCLPGFVWRNAFDGDFVCVAPEVRGLVANENATAASRRVQ